MPTHFTNSPSKSSSLKLDVQISRRHFLQWHFVSNATGITWTICCSKLKPGWTLFEHQSASISTNQDQLGPISINQHQSASNGKSISIKQFIKQHISQHQSASINISRMPTCIFQIGLSFLVFVHCLFVGEVMFPHQSDQMYQKVTSNPHKHGSYLSQPPQV